MRAIETHEVLIIQKPYNKIVNPTFTTLLIDMYYDLILDKYLNHNLEIEVDKYVIKLFPLKKQYDYKMSRIDLQIEDLAKQMEVLTAKLEATKRVMNEEFDSMKMNIPDHDRLYLEEAMTQAIHGKLDIAEFTRKIQNMKKWD